MYGKKLPQSVDELQPELRADDPESAESVPELPVSTTGFRSCMSHVMTIEPTPRPKPSLLKPGSHPLPTITRKEDENHEPPDMPENLNDEQKKMLAESMRASVFNLLGNECELSDDEAVEEGIRPDDENEPREPVKGYNLLTGLHEEMAPQPDGPDFR